MKDTFDDLYSTIQPLIVNKKYNEAREEVKKELYLLAGSLGGSTNEQLAMVKNKFMAFLPEDMRLLLETKNPEPEEKHKEENPADAASDYAKFNEETIARMKKEG